MATKTILRDTSLCAIVRDEIMNPAGGIQRFVESHVPYVEEAVIVDTGSIDGTREILEEMQKRYSHLKIFDKKFKGFSDARNFSLDKAKARYALVLDANELLTSEDPQNDWEIIQNNLSTKNNNYYHFEFQHIIPSGENIHRPSHNTRLFLIKNAKYCREIYECLDLDKISSSLNVKIKHFLPDKRSLDLKRKMYSRGWRNIFQLSKVFNPHNFKGFEEWKEYNPQRDNFI